MDKRIEIIKGIHPGRLIGRDLKKKRLSQRALSDKTGIRYQTINAIIGGKRALTTEQALKIEDILNYEEGFLSILQTYYDIQKYKENEFTRNYPHAPSVRKSLFWDVDFDKINWGKNKDTIIRRIMERGNKEEIEEINRYYQIPPTTRNHE